MRRPLAALSLALVLLLPTPSLAGSGAADLATDLAAQQVFERSHDKLVELLARGSKPSEIQQHVDALLDYEWIAQAALGGPSHYAARCGDRCAEFQALLTELIRASYIERLAKGDKATVMYLGEHVREAATKLDTKVTLEDGAGKTKVIEVDYIMHKVDGAWHVRDIITEGVSLAKTYRYDLNKLYKGGGMDEVIAALRTKLDELKDQK
ncbi:ABC-type transport system involved in resistance to organic solvents, auxiliary component [Enhygromyxa salina]|uniref:ABC-type transport system involved in resistance to organic solvents, auxiliary component n=1 Tax=Enhygromyxa salina TaxID=215803 RepID=A0A0C2CZB8_9BACT|nr:ABC transporter substrate-binding protein [Enhygromyxa salina]KIG14995.1 ABC-type transport system involved in resistance to organic solvents, auxiliary component [Enhygromyxa salina]